MKKMFIEFREFAMRGSVLDLAIGIIIGAAFGGVVNSFVKDILMPPFGLLLGKVDFASLYLNLSGTRFASLADAQAAGAPTLNYGLFLNTIINFIIVAFAIFLVVRAINKFQRKPAPVQPDTKECPFCASTISIKAIRCPNCTSPLS
jgi:large conductance mechanosensitive channel